MLVDSNGRAFAIRPVAPRQAPMRVRARFDAAQMGGPYAKHWANADWLSPNAAATPAIRRTLRSRCRYEAMNNAYAAGLISTLANYVIGTGPTLRLIPKDKTGKRASRALLDMASAFNEWAWDVSLAKKLNIMQRAKTTDGEGLALLVTRNVPDSKVSLGVRPFEADLLSNPQDFTGLSIDKPEGIDLGADGEPSMYHVLKHHPGGGQYARIMGEAFTVRPANICHWYEELRAGLYRGIPEIVSALPMFAQLRRYTSAVVTAAEAAASFSGVLQTDTLPGEFDEVEASSTFDVESGTFITTPAGWKMAQVRSEHPGPMHEAFIRTMVREIGRCIDMPYAVAAMDASGHNYSSMRGDWQAFFASLRYRRYICEQLVLEKILGAWIPEAELVNRFGSPPAFDYVWDWPAAEPTDPLKEAEAVVLKLKSNLTTYAREYAKVNLNSEDELRQRGLERATLAELGLLDPSALPESPAKEADGSDAGGDAAKPGQGDKP